MSWSIGDLAENDRVSVVDFYAKLNELMSLDCWQINEPAIQREHVKRWAQQSGWNQCWRNMAALGPETYTQFGESNLLRQVIHDLRGGPLTSLVMTMNFLVHHNESDPEYIWLLARDVRKIARNCFPDLDAKNYQKDSCEKAHSVRLIGEKWRKTHGDMVSVNIEFTGNIANSCVEFSALDRTLYNLMNNALRESPSRSDKVELVALTETGQSNESHVRFWVRNRVTSHQKAVLEQRFGENLGELFLSNFSTTGSGLGMQIVGDFVSKAYGLTGQRALSMGLFGALLEESHFNAWFHWPAVP